MHDVGKRPSGKEVQEDDFVMTSFGIIAKMLSRASFRVEVTGANLS